MKKPINNNLILELHVPDFSLVRSFYGLFGFEEMEYDPTSGGGSDLGYLILKREDPMGRTTIHFYGDKPKIAEHAYFNRFPPETPRGYEVEITVVVLDIDTLWKKVKGELKEEQIAQEFVVKRWGNKDFRVIDPFGFYIRFTEPVEKWPYE